MRKKMIMLVVVCLGLSSSSLAMEEQGTNSSRIDNLAQDADWIMLSKDAILAAIESVPSQANSYSCGPITLAHCAKAANLEINCAEFINGCPLSVEATVEKLESNVIVSLAVMSKLSNEQLKEGALRVGPAPGQMEGWFNDCFESSKNKLIAVSETEMTKETLIKLLHESLANNLPAILFTTAGTTSIHYTLAVGINLVTAELLVMDTVKSTHQLRTEKIVNIYEKMNVFQTISFVNTIQNLEPQIAMFVNFNHILSQRVPKCALDDWKNYNVLVVKEPTVQEKEKLANRKKIRETQNAAFAVARKSAESNKGACAQQ